MAMAMATTTRTMAALCVAIVLCAQVWLQADAAPLATRRSLLQAFSPTGAPEVAPVESPEFAPELAPSAPSPAAWSPEISPAGSPEAEGPTGLSPGPAPLVSSASGSAVSCFGSLLVGFAAFFLL